MLDRAKLVAKVTQNADQVIYKQDSQVSLALATWHKIILDLNFKTNLLGANLPFSVPDWHGELGLVQQISTQRKNYTVIAADGSQVYPDRHMGSDFFLINIGLVVLRYNQQSSYLFSTEPYFFTTIEPNMGNITDYVDSKRHELEVKMGLDLALIESKTAQKTVFLVDGSLIAWHLAGKPENLRNNFLPIYLEQLQTFYDHQLPLIGYTSLPNSTDLINLLRASLNNFQIEPAAGNVLPDLVDIDFLAYFLPAGAMTNWFKSQVSVVKDYPDHLKIYFAYFNTGYEIARIELPAWVLDNNDLIQICLQVIVDQIYKGYGYPVALAEAHTQAVVKSIDRQFFYQVIKQFACKPNTSKISKKLYQKQIMHF